jgi:hypothetical protein
MDGREALRVFASVCGFGNVRAATDLTAAQTSNHRTAEMARCSNSASETCNTLHQLFRSPV